MMSNRLIVLMSVFVGAFSSAFAAEDWPTFRGPQGDGVIDRPLPTEWGTNKNIAWRTEIPGEGWSSPVTAGNRIYLTAAIPSGERDEDQKKQAYTLSLIIIEATSGKILKTISIMEQTVERPARIHRKNSHASPTPIIDRDRIYVHFGYQGTACLTLNGEVVWTNRELYFKPTHGNGGSPVMASGNLIFTCDGDAEPKIVALNAANGQLAWSTPRPVSAKKTFSFCTPTVIEVDGQLQVIAPGSDCVLALDPATGETIWDVRYVGYSVVPKPSYHRGLVFISTSFDSSKMLAIRPTGKGVVTDTHVAWQLDRNVPKTPSMVAHQGLVYSISDDGIATCVEAETGDLVYRKRIGGNYSSSPLLAGGKLYFTSEDGVTTVVRAGEEFEELGANTLEERTLASLGVIDDSILLRTATALYRIQE
ncbi:PQQ-like beta-propeller repeat protein [Rubripirellula sp.]|nr:PQQ-binding-like beta-propeller repeat protein [Rubripirellula sp.]MDB4634455.1 PQQ-like beta-propeller repeat protein [Rubripirellula sp.]MDB4654658.1 PQQ-like beta-propeller repeat protein [Rubripirellula sp.]